MQRRTFIRSTPALFALPSLATRFSTAPLRVALIGCGWYGKSDLMRLLQVTAVEVVGLCDVDREHLTEADRWVRERQTDAAPALFTDYEELLAETRPDLVLIATPDHWHALQAIAAMEAGADLYLQKPVGVDVRECEAVLRHRPSPGPYRTGGYPAAQHPPPGRGQGALRGYRRARHHRARRNVLLLPHARYGRAGSKPGARPLRLRALDRPRAPAALTGGFPTAAGAPSRRTATASWAICACTCSTPPAGCSAWATPPG